jgi:hypothetical protein
VWPNPRPAVCPVAHTSAPAPAAAPRPTARSWSPGLVNGGASGGRCPPGGRGDQESCHTRATPHRRLALAGIVLEGGAPLLRMQRDQRSQRRITPPPRAPRDGPLAALAVAGRCAARGRVELRQRLPDTAGWAPLVGPCLGRHSRVRLVVHLTGSFHRGSLLGCRPGAVARPGPPSIATVELRHAVARSWMRSAAPRSRASLCRLCDREDPEPAWTAWPTPARQTQPTLPIAVGDVCGAPPPPVGAGVRAVRSAQARREAQPR